MKFYKIVSFLNAYGYILKYHFFLFIFQEIFKLCVDLTPGHFDQPVPQINDNTLVKVKDLNLSYSKSNRQVLSNFFFTSVIF